MAGKFINTKYRDTVESVVSMHDDLIKNPFYGFNDKKETIVTYYNINMEKSMLDEGSKLAYADLGSQSPIRFNVIRKFILYQFAKAELNLENGDFGLEGNPISGESYIIPNTINPTEGDYFEVDYVKDSTWLFKVTDVQRDTLENGGNLFKITWVLDRTCNREILNNVVEEFQYMNVIEGTNMAAVVRSDKYKLAERLDNLATSLRDYFCELFYDKNVQTFIYLMYNNSYMYDPYSIEFVLRNHLLDSIGDEYVYVEHKYMPNTTFSIDYDKTFFRAFEKRDKEVLNGSIYQSHATCIKSPISIFNTRYEDYYALDYKVYLQTNNSYYIRGLISVLPEEFIERIVKNHKYTEKGDLYKNIMIKYFNDEDILSTDIDSIEYIEYNAGNPIDDYYMILLLIFCVDFYTNYLLS